MTQSESGYSGEIKLGRAFGLGGGIALVVGSIIGMAIYTLIAPIAANGGNAMWLAFVIAIAISAIGVVPIIQVASAIPRAGVGYLATSRLSNPYCGGIASLLVIIGGTCATCFVCIGFAQIIASYWNWGIDMALEIRLLSLIIPILFMGLYLFKLQLANMVQIVMVILKVLALLVFVGVGLLMLSKPVQLSFVSPQGISGMILAVILSYSACIGFQVIAEMGEEMTHPKRNIPLSMIIGGIIVLIVYILVGAVFMAAIPYDYDNLINMKAPLLTAAQVFLSPGWVAVISFGALFAALTALNAGAMAIPREIFGQARDNLLPSGLSEVSSRTLTPLRSIGAFLIVMLLILCLQFLNVDIEFYGVMAAVGMLTMTVIVDFTVINLPLKFPKMYRKAFIQISRPWLITLAIITALTSIPFIVLVMFDYKNALLVLGIYIGIIILYTLYYFFRVNWLKKQGVDWRERTKTISDSEE